MMSEPSVGLLALTVSTAAGGAAGGGVCTPPPSSGTGMARWVGERRGAREFDAVIVRGRTYKTGDVALLRSPSGRLPYVAKIVRLWEAENGAKMMLVQWYYRVPVRARGSDCSRFAYLPPQGRRTMFHLFICFMRCLLCMFLSSTSKFVRVLFSFCSPCPLQRECVVKTRPFVPWQDLPRSLRQQLRDIGAEDQIVFSELQDENEVDCLLKTIQVLDSDTHEECDPADVLLCGWVFDPSAECQLKRERLKSPRVPRAPPFMSPRTPQSQKEGLSPSTMYSFAAGAVAVLAGAQELVTRRVGPEFQAVIPAARARAGVASSVAAADVGAGTPDSGVLVQPPQLAWKPDVLDAGAVTAYLRSARLAYNAPRARVGMRVFVERESKPGGADGDLAAAATAVIGVICDVAASEGVVCVLLADNTEVTFSVADICGFGRGNHEGEFLLQDDAALEVLSQSAFSCEAALERMRAMSTAEVLLLGSAAPGWRPRNWTASEACAFIVAVCDRGKAAVGGAVGSLARSDVIFLYYLYKLPRGAAAEPGGCKLCYGGRAFVYCVACTGWVCYDCFKQRQQSGMCDDGISWRKAVTMCRWLCFKCRQRPVAPASVRGDLVPVPARRRHRKHSSGLDERKPKRMRLGKSGRRIHNSHLKRWRDMEVCVAISARTRACVCSA